MRIFEKANYQIIQKRKTGYIISLVFLAIGLGSILFKGLGYGIDFTGGTEIQLQFSQPVEIDDVRRAMSYADLSGELKRFGGPNDVLFRTSTSDNIDQLTQKIKSGVYEIMPEQTVTLLGNYEVSPRIASDLKEGAIFAVLGALIIILLYITFRFEFRFAVASIIALFHDVLIVLGLFSLLYNVIPGLNLEIDQTIIAAFLTIVGYSLNDTVVIFDRIREYRKIFKGESREEVINKSINSTLSRTIMVSFTTFVVMLVLFLFGGESTKAFSFAMLMGVIVGTYSSIFVASPIVHDWESRAELKSTT